MVVEPKVSGVARYDLIGSVGIDEISVALVGLSAGTSPPELRAVLLPLHIPWHHGSHHEVGFLTVWQFQITKLLIPPVASLCQLEERKVPQSSQAYTDTGWNCNRPSTMASRVQRPSKGQRPRTWLWIR